jgi:alkylation response protein AidB-like acyl-CoA dehydrogenase
MNFDWTKDEAELIKRVAGLWDEAALADLAALETAALETGDGSDLAALTRKQIGRLAEAGAFAVAVGPSAKAETLRWMALMENVAQASGSLLLAAESSVRLFGGLLAGWGGGPLANLLGQVVSGEAIGALALSEPGGNQPQTGGRTQGRKEGDGYRVTGTKGFVANGPMADMIAVSGQVEGKTAFFLVQPGQEGVKIGPRMATLGYNGLAVSTLDLDHAFVPADRVIGPLADDEAVRFLHTVQDLILVAASLGVMIRTHNEANAYSRTYHRGAKPIYSHQEVRFKLADTFTLMQTSQLLAYRAAWFQATGEKEAPVLIHAAKVFTAEAAEKVSSLAMQILAGRGYVMGNPVERGYREAKFAALAGTTSEVARMSIAEDVLRRFPVA